MQQVFSPDFMRANRGCYDLRDIMCCSFMKGGGEITLRRILESEIPLKDKYWFVCRKLATKEQNQQIAIRVAEMVLPLFEQRRPGDDRPRMAIEAAKQFIAGHISIDELRQKRNAAYAAAADAAAAAAAYAAVYAAYAAKLQLQNYLLTFCE